MKKATRLIIFLVLIKLILPYLLQSPNYELHRDEFLYLAEGRHLAWGYLEIPPLLPVFSWFIHILGNSAFWVKFFPDLFGTLTFIVTAKIVQSLGGKLFAIFLVFLPFVFGAYLRLFFLFQPNAPEIFFWSLMAYSVIRFVQTEKNFWLYVFGIAAGLGLLSKYSVAFFLIGILSGLLLSPARKIYLNKHLYFSGILAFIIFLPNLLWQYNHRFPVVVHMNELTKYQLKYVSPLGFLADQLLFNFPTFFIWVSGLIFILFSPKAKKYRAFGYAWITVIIILLIFQGKSYYALGGYPMLFGFGAFYLENYFSNRSVMWKYGIVAFSFLTGIYMIPLLLPVAGPQPLANYYQKRKIERYGLLKWEDQKDHPLPQDFADMLGWKEMTEKVSTAYNALTDEEKKNAIIYCDNYGEAGALNYYGKNYRLPEAYSHNGSFLFWIPDNTQWENIILVTDNKKEMQLPFIKQFKTAFVFDSVTNKYAREYGSLIITFKGPDEELRSSLIERIKKKRAMFERVGVTVR